LKFIEIQNLMKALIQKLLPRSLYRAILVPYHVAWAFGSALNYGFPAKKLIVIGVTGTKGKSSVAEMLSTILESAGHTVAVSSTIHFKIGATERPNMYKMTLPGRGFIQKFLRDAVTAKCTHAIIELTSESAIQYRHLFLSLDALIFTNLEKEHLESHGSMEKYFQAKLRLGKALVHSKKRPRAVIANVDNPYGKKFLKLAVERQISYSIHDVTQIQPTEAGITFTYDNTLVALAQPGNFSILNALAAIKTAQFLSVHPVKAISALASLARIPGRAERIEAGQDFLAIVDYAHTPDSLQALYDAYKDKRKICVLGNTGGGRDTWKRPEMGRIADAACAEIILTDEDPYNEDPRAILDAMAAGMKTRAYAGVAREPRVIMDRREAIRTALSLARAGNAVLITGKGTDPYIMQAHDAKTPWSDATVVREELEKLGHTKA
jgi:UDP-N-acetylmuramoyl-L-alanyl-D-glutamate--2,6-diaminopimelate ligase